LTRAQEKQVCVCIALTKQHLVRGVVVFGQHAPDLTHLLRCQPGAQAGVTQDTVFDVAVAGFHVLFTSGVPGFSRQARALPLP
jgi:hypothetical protein